MKQLITFIYAILLGSIVFGQSIEATTKTGQKIVLYQDKTWEYSDVLALKEITPYYGVVGLKSQGTVPNNLVVSHTDYILSYNPNYRLASWVSYELTKEMLLKQPRIARADKFTRDPAIPQNMSAMDADYRKSGYDRGHLCPAADMAHSEKTMEESFYYSNMTPQKPGFNRGVWNRLEDQVRMWALDNDKIYVATGPVLSAKYVTKEKSLYVPKYFYKVLLDYEAPEVKGIGFIIPNESSSEPLSSFAVSIDSVEAMTGIDFFSALPDKEEKIIESVCDYSLWDKQSSSVYSARPPAYNSTSTDVTAPKDSTSSGKRCKAITKAGTQCKRMAEPGSDYCWQHKQIYENKDNTKVFFLKS